MKNYFLNLFRYDFYANKIIFSVIRTAANVGRPIELMKHIFSVNKVWYDRCNGEQTTSVQLPGDKDDPYRVIEGLISQNYNTWSNFISGLSDADFKTPVKYQNSAGMTFENSLSDILTQVIIHGTHHRAQIGQHMKISGLEALPNTDYINFIRFSG